MEVYYDVYGVHVIVKCEGSEKLLKKLNVDYGWFLVEDKVDSMDLRFYVNCNENIENKGFVSVCGNNIYIDGNNFVFSGEHLGDDDFYTEDFRPYFTTAIYYCLYTNSRDIMIHSAAVDYEGHTVLFIGDSGCGKSSLALRCVLDGGSYFSNDITYLSLDNGNLMVKALPQELNIGDQAYKWFEANIKDFDKLCEEKTMIFLHKFEKKCILPQSIKKDTNLFGKVSCVVFPEPMLNKEEPKIEKISKSVAIRQIYQQILPMFKRGYYPDIEGFALIDTLKSMLEVDKSIEFYSLYWCGNHDKNLEAIKSAMR